MYKRQVVVGYGVQKKENLTGSVAAVNFKDVASMPVANTDRKSTRLNSSHLKLSRMPSSA